MITTEVYVQVGLMLALCFLCLSRRLTIRVCRLLGLRRGDVAVVHLLRAMAIGSVGMLLILSLAGYL